MFFDLCDGISGGFSLVVACICLTGCVLVTLFLQVSHVKQINMEMKSLEKQIDSARAGKQLTPPPLPARTGYKARPPSTPRQGGGDDKPPSTPRSKMQMKLLTTAETQGQAGRLSPISFATVEWLATKIQAWFHGKQARLQIRRAAAGGYAQRHD